MDVSVVIPTYRRPDLLLRCLDALAHQDADGVTFEILVADDGSDAATERAVKSFADRATMPVRNLPVGPAHGPAAARNVGWRAAAAPVVAFTDDDCLPDSRWLSTGLQAFREHPLAMAVVGKIIVPLPPTPTDYERDAAGLETTEFVTANCFCRAAALAIVGGFDERYRTAWREDSDLQFAILNLGGDIIRDDRVRVVHPVRPAQWGISLKQQKKCLYDALLFKKHPSLFRERVFPATPWLYYVILLTIAAAGAAVILEWKLVALICASAWLLLTLHFAVRRLRGTSRSLEHIAEMLVTSALIPPLSVFWRLYGAAKFRVWFM